MAKMKEIDVLKSHLAVVKAKNAGITLDSLATKTMTDFTNVTVPAGTLFQVPAEDEINDFLYNEPFKSNGNTYDVFGMVMPVVDTAGKVIGAKRIPIASLQRQEVEYKMENGVPVATGKTLGGDSDLANTLRSKEVIADKVKYLCGKTIECKNLLECSVAKYTDGVITGVRTKKTPQYIIKS
jgi:hypothetical protein